MEDLFSSIPSSMRPAQSIVDHVKNTLKDLVSSVLEEVSYAEENIENPGELENPEEHPVDLSNGVHLIKNNDSVNESGHVPHLSLFIRSKEAFNKRLKTFSLSLWCGKPLSLSPPLLAQYGWECIGEDVVRCCLCSAVLAIRLPWPNSSNYHSECRKNQSNVIEAHHKICSWPSNPSHDSFIFPFNPIYLSVKQKDDMKTGFIDRANRLISLREDLPHIATDILLEMELDDTTVSHVMKLCEFDEQSSDDPEEKRSLHEVRVAAVSLSLCGWDMKDDQQLPSIYCKETGRLVGLWNFHSVVSETNPTGSPSPKKRRVDLDNSNSVIEQCWFHPLKQHHIWSPWIIALKSLSQLKDNWTDLPVQENVNPGWWVLKDLLLNTPIADNQDLSPEKTASSEEIPVTVFLKKVTKTPPNAAVQRTRRMLDDWSR